MISKKIQLLASLIALVALGSCQKEPSTSSLHKDYLVYTAYDANVNFADIDAYFLPDSILLIGPHDKPTYWKEDHAQEIIARVAAEMDAAGFVRTTEKSAADVGLQLSYVERRTYFVGADFPHWWGWYPHYWSPTYWGDWGGWYYPYSVQYGYTAGSLLIEMLHLTTTAATNRKLPVIWDAFISGLLTSSAQVNQQRTLDAIEQAFAQSPYLTTSNR